MTTQPTTARRKQLLPAVAEAFELEEIADGLLDIERAEEVHAAQIPEREAPTPPDPKSDGIEQPEPAEPQQ